MNLMKFGSEYVNMDRMLYIEELGPSYIIHFDVSYSTFWVGTTLYINTTDAIEDMQKWLSSVTQLDKAGPQ